MEQATAENRSGAERILDAAILLFGEHGVRGTSLKVIAAEAGVSQALIVHHYGTKDGLRAACDDHVAHMIRVRKEETIGAEPQFDPFVALRSLEHSRPLLRYLVRALTEGGAHASHLIDEMVSDAADYMAQGERAGLIKSSDVPRDRTVLLVIWSLGALTLHEHVHRLLGVDFLADEAPPESLQRYLRPAMELYTQGLMEEGAFERLAGFLGAPGAESENAPETDTEAESVRSNEREQ